MRALRAAATSTGKRCFKQGRRRLGHFRVQTGKRAAAAIIHPTHFPSIPSTLAGQPFLADFQFLTFSPSPPSKPIQGSIPDILVAPRTPNRPLLRPALVAVSGPRAFYSLHVRQALTAFLVFIFHCKDTQLGLRKHQTSNLTVQFTSHILPPSCYQHIDARHSIEQLHTTQARALVASCSRRSTASPRYGSQGRWLQMGMSIMFEGSSCQRMYPHR